MFIETLEFTIPIDLCSLFSTLQKGPRSNLEFPASVNSYGTTQDACLHVGVRANKLTFRVDGVSSDSSMISKSECKTLKLAVFDVDRSLIPQESDNLRYESTSMLPTISAPSKRVLDNSYSSPVPVKSSRTSYHESPHRSPVQNIPQSQSKPRPSSISNQSQAKSQSDNVNVKQEPEDPDLIEIEPDPEPDDADLEPKKEVPFMQIDYSSDVPHTQTSQAALDRVSFPPTSRSQSSSFHQNVPHVQDYSQPGPSQLQQHGDQSADEFLVFQDDNGDYGDDNDNSADYSNDDGHDPGHGSGRPLTGTTGPEYSTFTDYPTFEEDTSFLNLTQSIPTSGTTREQRHLFPCSQCEKVFHRKTGLVYHMKAIHENLTLYCVCGKPYKYQTTLNRHHKFCSVYMLSKK